VQSLDTHTHCKEPRYTRIGQSLHTHTHCREHLHVQAFVANAYVPKHARLYLDTPTHPRLWIGGGSEGNACQYTRTCPYRHSTRLGEATRTNALYACQYRRTCPYRHSTIARTGGGRGLSRVHMQQHTEGGGERTEGESKKKKVVTRVGDAFRRGWKRFLCVCVGARLQRCGSARTIRLRACGGQALATRCNTLQHAVTHCNTLQHTATHCNTLQHTTTHCFANACHSNHTTKPLTIPFT